MSGLPEATKKPCRECPWRRVAAAGWLGPYDAQTWVELAHSETPIACHMTIDEEETEGDWTAPDLRQCAGAAQYRKNVAMLPRNRDIAIALNKDIDTVFTTPFEFIEHHTKGNA